MLGISSKWDIITEVQQASQLALLESGGQAGNRQVELVFVDTADPQQTTLREQAAIAKAVEDPAVVAVITAGNSDAARETIPFLNRLGLTCVSLTATWPGLTKPGFAPGEPGIFYPTGQRNFFRMIPSDDIQAVTAVQWMKEQGFQSVYVLHTETVYSTGLANIVVAQAPLSDLTIVGHEQVTHFSPAEQAQLAERILLSDPDVLYYAADPSIDFSLEVTLRTYDPELTIIGGETLTFRRFPDDITALEGIYATNMTPSLEQLTSVGSFVEAYQEQYGEAPSSFAVPGYEAVNVILQAIAQADEPTRAGVLEAMHQLGDISGVMGNWSFDAHGDTSLQITNVLQLQQGEWVSIDSIR
ncbi:MAG: ABC transporter substrate-binding protein [Chloroflexaceae bacterium]|nr:ABC transporter substrate-binding protein [Chloroflexaceae bacterium]